MLMMAVWGIVIGVIYSILKQARYQGSNGGRFATFEERQSGRFYMVQMDGDYVKAISLVHGDEPGEILINMQSGPGWDEHYVITDNINQKALAKAFSEHDLNFYEVHPTDWKHTWVMDDPIIQSSQQG